MGLGSATGPRRPFAAKTHPSTAVTCQDCRMRAEVRLRVPNMKVRALDQNGYPIDHSSMRFRKLIEIPGFPRVGDQLILETQSGRTLSASVVHVDLDEARSLFVLSCQYASRSILAEDYAALSEDPAWELKHLLE